MTQIPKKVRAIDGGPAFPTSEEYERNGMTLRQWLAGQALAGGCGFHGDDNVPNEQLVHHAVEIADKLLEKLREPVEILVDACDHGVEIDDDTGVANCETCLATTIVKAVTGAQP